MKERHLSYRQVHLDFHTGGAVPGVGATFSPEDFQHTLVESAVDSVTCFAVCHHGFCYYPSQVGPVHPSLNFNLLRAQMDAAHAAGIRVPVYISAGGNEEAFRRHTEWLEIPPPGMQSWGGTGDPPLFHKLCFNTPYLEFLCRQTAEVIRHFPDADGLFFDIVFQGECLCPACQAGMRERRLNPENPDDRRRYGTLVMENYYRRITETIRQLAPEMAVFHNSSHVNPLFPEFLPYYSHWELESLPTGGWGYDHFPLTAAYARKTKLLFTGMTGKFHGTWGEFGGLKTPQALRYECSLMLAAGARCSIGDQCHPCGKLDKSTYAVIGEAYREVRQKEPFCENAVNRAEIALLAVDLSSASAVGISRILQEGHFLFDVLRPDMDYSAYPMVVVPEDAAFCDREKQCLKAFAEQGGKILLAGRTAKEFDLDFGAEMLGESELYPTYMLPETPYRPAYLSTPVVCYAKAMKLRSTTGQSLGRLFYPYFNRSPQKFSGHSHTPNCLEPSADELAVRHGNLAVLSMPLFASYAEHGQVVLKEFLVAVIAEMLGEERIVITNLPSMARCHVTEDKSHSRQVVHLLYANLLKRGDGVEIVDELLPLHDVDVSVHMGKHKVKEVFLEPQHEKIPFGVLGYRVNFHVRQFTCHQMVAIEY